MSGNPIIFETREAFSVWANSDLTEGRGFELPIAHCWAEATARRFARGRDVQGSDAKVIPFTALKIENRWYGPIRIEHPTREDDRAEAKLKLWKETVEKAKKCGLSAEELERIIKGPGTPDSP